MLLAFPFRFNRLRFTRFFRILTAVDELTPNNPITSFLVIAPCIRAYSNTFSSLALVGTPSKALASGSEESAGLLPISYFALIFGSMILKAFFIVSITGFSSINKLIDSINIAESYKAKRDGKEPNLMERAYPHALRHTFAPLCYLADIDAKVTQRMMGHASYSTTIDIYTHIGEAYMTTDTRKLDLFKIPDLSKIA